MHTFFLWAYVLGAVLLAGLIIRLELKIRSGDVSVPAEHAAASEDYRLGYAAGLRREQGFLAAVFVAYLIHAAAKLL